MNPSINPAISHGHYGQQHVGQQRVVPAYASGPSPHHATDDDEGMLLADLVKDRDPRQPIPRVPPTFQHPPYPPSHSQRIHGQPMTHFNTQYHSPHQPSSGDYSRDGEYDSMKELAEGLNDSFAKIDDSLIESSTESEQKKRRKKKKNQTEPAKPPVHSNRWLFVEFILIVLLFCVLSQPSVQNFITQRISYLKPNEDGTVSQIGYAIYGSILAALFLLIRGAISHRF